jgi:mannose-6-phosphate isomerase-like protein (cupin superfamily)
VSGMEAQNFFDIAQLEILRKISGKSYLEFLRVSSLSAGVYVLAAGSTDTQKPHREDEMYYVVRGRARMRVGGDEQAVAAGSIIFVAANVQHNFYDIAEELVVLVFFAPAES